ncbi:MAG TPA: hypothetical protein VI815_03030 [Candidatus Nanoarchaeia archaeon]|nr:hypothetical protein [Candidatus Nanoarchaeia archaeon]
MYIYANLDNQKIVRGINTSDIELESSLTQVLIGTVNLSQSDGSTEMLNAYKMINNFKYEAGLFNLINTKLIDKASFILRFTPIELMNLSILSSQNVEAQSILLNLSSTGNIDVFSINTKDMLLKLVELTILSIERVNIILT